MKRHLLLQPKLEHLVDKNSAKPDEESLVSAELHADPGIYAEISELFLEEWRNLTDSYYTEDLEDLSLIHISEPTRPY